MSYTERNCDNCKKEYKADNRNLKRGWGLCCSKSCAAKKREKSKPGYNEERVKSNNIRRSNWTENGKDIWVKKRGYPDYETYLESSMDDDGSWDAHQCSVGICDYCNLRYDYCRCGDGSDEY